MCAYFFRRNNAFKITKKCRKIIPRRLLGIAVLLIWALPACSAQEPGLPPSPTPFAAARKLPARTLKIQPGEDPHPPRLHHPAWADPIPLPGPINTAGGEDSPFITADGRELYFFFTPDVSLPAEEQLGDGMTGIYRATKTSRGWGNVERVVLSEGPSLDGCPFVLGDQLWFCSTRPGQTGVGWYKAERRSGTWNSWQPVTFPEEYQVGELHISADGSTLYFGSSRPGTVGGSDLWASRWDNGSWGEPENLRVLNTAADESRPFLTPDGNQLWFTRTYQGTPGIFLSRQVNGTWGEPELIISRFAGEPTLDEQGNLYFIHHFFLDGEMVEADIYLAAKK